MCLATLLMKHEVVTPLRSVPSVAPPSFFTFPPSPLMRDVYIKVATVARPFKVFVRQQFFALFARPISSRSLLSSGTSVWVSIPSPLRLFLSEMMVAYPKFIDA